MGVTAILRTESSDRKYTGVDTGELVMRSLFYCHTLLIAGYNARQNYITVLFILVPSADGERLLSNPEQHLLDDDYH
jgi:hypothetical protein